MKSFIFVALLFSSFCLLSAASSADVHERKRQSGEEELLGKTLAKQQQQSGKRRLKILVYSTSLSWSHAQFLGKIADTLHEAGHDVHLFKFVSDQTLLKRNESRLVRKVHLLMPNLSSVDKLDIHRLNTINNVLTGERPVLSVFGHPWEEFVDVLATACKDIIHSTEMLDRLAAEHFDVAIAELYDLCPMAVFHRIGVKTTLAAFAVPLLPMTARKYGIPTPSSYFPNMHTPIEDVVAGIPFITRLVNAYNELYDWWWMDDCMVRAEQPLITKAFGPNFPSIKQLARTASLVFINSNPFFDLARPISSKIVHIGGLVNHKEQRLDQDTQQILDTAKNGAVLMSFGSITDTSIMSAQMRSAIVRAFARFPHTEFLWKLDSSSRQNASALLAQTPNVHIFEWIQQNAVLKHPNLRAFITHCGQNSLTEAARAGVPVLGIPLFGDQHFNSLVAKRAQMGVILDVHKLNGPNAEQALVVALTELLHQSKYNENAKLIKQKLAVTPFSPAERLVRWVEFAAEFSPLNELNLPGDEEIHWFMYYSLDVATFTLAVLLAFAMLAWQIAKWTTLLLFIQVWRRRTTAMAFVAEWKKHQ